MSQIIDGSHYKPVQDWTALSSAVPLLIWKCTQGGGANLFKDPTWPDVRSNCASKNLPLVGFLFATGDSAADQWSAFKTYANLDGTIGVSLDVEGNLNGLDVTGAILEEIINAAFQDTGFYPLIYTRKSFLDELGLSPSSVVFKCQLWVADPNSTNAPILPAGFSSWSLWQYGGGAIPGIQSLVDYDRLNPNLDLQSFFLSISKMSVVQKSPAVPTSNQWTWPLGVEYKETDTAPVDTVQVGDEWRSNWVGAIYDLLGSQAVHTGDDIVLYDEAGAIEGHPIYAVASGSVIYAQKVFLSSGQESSWGNLIVIQHAQPDGSHVYSRYAHCLDIQVSKGQNVSVGQVIGHVGNADGMLPYHLHFDISNTELLLGDPTNWPSTGNSTSAASAIIANNYVDPRQFLLQHNAANQKDLTMTNLVQATVIQSDEAPIYGPDDVTVVSSVKLASTIEVDADSQQNGWVTLSTGNRIKIANLSPLPAASVVQTTKTMYVSADELFVHSSDDLATTSRVKDASGDYIMLPQNTPLSVSDPAVGGIRQISSGAMQGYFVSDQFVSASVSIPQVQQGTKFSVNGNRLRMGASSTAAIIRVLSAGEWVATTGETQSDGSALWLPVVTDKGEDGFVEWENIDGSGVLLDPYIAPVAQPIPPVLSTSSSTFTGKFGLSISASGINHDLEGQIIAIAQRLHDKGRPLASVVVVDDIPMANALANYVEEVVYRQYAIGQQFDGSKMTDTDSAIKYGNDFYSLYIPIMAQLDKRIILQPVNEAGNPLWDGQMFLQFMKRSDADKNNKIGCFGDSTGNPTTAVMQRRVQALTYAKANGHFYVRHNYSPFVNNQPSSLPVSTANGFEWAGGYHRTLYASIPQSAWANIIIGEAGNSDAIYHGPDLLIADMKAYNQELQSDTYVLGFCTWEFGKSWQNAAWEANGALPQIEAMIMAM